ncbi:MAG: IS3 family transposase [Flavobacteriaceae bacterium]|nr:IS3 family transposase [Flavobacteriaceae bacterium]
MTAYLKRYGYQINHKKLYRIMKEEGLMNYLGPRARRYQNNFNCEV